MLFFISCKKDGIDEKEEIPIIINVDTVYHILEEKYDNIINKFVYDSTYRLTKYEIYQDSFIYTYYSFLYEANVLKMVNKHNTANVVENKYKYHYSTLGILDSISTFNYTGFDYIKTDVTLLFWQNNNIDSMAEYNYIPYEIYTYRYKITYNGENISEIYKDIFPNVWRRTTYSYNANKHQYSNIDIVYFISNKWFYTKNSIQNYHYESDLGSIQDFNYYYTYNKGYYPEKITIKKDGIITQEYNYKYIIEEIIEK